MLNQPEKMRLYMKDNISLYLFVSVLFVMGVIFGALMVNALSLDQKEDITRYLGSFFHSIDQGTVPDGKYSFMQTYGMHVKWIVLIWVLGLSVIGLPIILILDFLKGVLIGFTVGYLVGQLSWKGLLFALVSVAPQNLIIIPAFIICSVAAISFSVFLIRNRLLQRKGTVSQPFISYTLTAMILLVILLGVSLFESFVSPSLMKWVTPMLLSL